MKKSIIVLFILIVTSGCVTTDKGVNSECWKCTAKGLISSRYTGRDSAYIHLREFKDGNNYKVQLNESKCVATGTTANGTPFTCTKMK